MIIDSVTPTQWFDNCIFMIFELLAGEVLKKWKNRILAGEVSQSVKIVLPRWVRIKKKSDRHAAWECQNWFLRHLSNENANLKNDQIFVVVDFGGFREVKKLLKWMNQ